MNIINILSILAIAGALVIGAFLDRASADTKAMIEDARSMNKALDDLIATKEKGKTSL